MAHIHSSRPVLTIDLDDSIPVVQQIANGLRRSLLDGALAAGDALPSSRALARDLGVHFNTVAQAYRELEAEGWLTLKRRAGTVVLDRSAPALADPERAVLRERFAAQLQGLATQFESQGLGRDELERESRRVLGGSTRHLMESNDDD